LHKKHHSYLAEKSKMDLDLSAIQDAIEDEARAWAATFVAQRKAFLSAKKINASGALQQSIASETVRQASAGIIETLIEFEDSGRYIDMKKLQPSKGGDLYILALENWLKDRGFFAKWRASFEDKYEGNRKYSRISSGKTRDARALSRMAWGIAINRSNGKMKRKRWYNTPKTAALTELYNRVAANLPSIAADAITKQFN
jgi:hypothetical protein